MTTKRTKERHKRWFHSHYWSERIVYLGDELFAEVDVVLRFDRSAWNWCVDLAGYRVRGSARSRVAAMSESMAVVRREVV